MVAAARGVPLRCGWGIVPSSSLERAGLCGMLHAGGRKRSQVQVHGRGALCGADVCGHGTWLGADTDMELLWTWRGLFRPAYNAAHTTARWRMASGAACRYVCGNRNPQTQYINTHVNTLGILDKTALARLRLHLGTWLAHRVASRAISAYRARPANPDTIILSVLSTAELPLPKFN